jgi:hypothetical protein
MPFGFGFLHRRNWLGPVTVPPTPEEADIHDASRTVCLKQTGEFFKRARGMANRLYDG